MDKIKLELEQYDLEILLRATQLAMADSPVAKLDDGDVTCYDYAVLRRKIIKQLPDDMIEIGIDDDIWSDCVEVG